jgi:hypothetical protein
MLETSASRDVKIRAVFFVRLVPWLAWGLFSSSSAYAKPVAPELVCRSYPNIPDCSGRLVTCSHCHASVYPTSWNVFGASVKSELAPGTAFEDALPDALAALEPSDSDGDGLSNLEELELGTAPGDAASGFTEAPVSEGADNPQYDVGNYDYAFAYRRVMILYCGASPSYDQRRAFDADHPDAETLRERLHAALSECLDSKHWSETALPRLADKRIRPLQAAGPDSMIRIGTSGRRLVVGDYRYDYRMWRYLLTGDRDMRDLLTARYHVTEDESGELQQVSGVLPKEDPMAFAGGQPLEEEQRAGMLTTQWFLAINTMFSSLPRTSAAQAYRSYLGADISSGEGIRPVPGEPADIDDKGVADPRCATCHSTLDPLAYAFAKYEGIDSMFGGGFGGYEPDRVTRMPRWSDAAQRPVLFGQEVGSLPEWAQVAAESDMFKRNMAEVFFEHALTRTPGPADQQAFKALWQAMPEDDYSANRLIHRLVDTQAFGVP